MIRKVLVANRGEIAVRVIRACRDMGIRTVALYEPPDLGAFHMRLADESAAIDTPAGFLDQAAVLEIAQRLGADAIHPGYGYLAESGEFARRCTEASITFIGAPPGVLELTTDKQKAISRVRQSGVPVVTVSDEEFGPETAQEIVSRAAQALGYPLVVKTCRGGRTLVERLVRSHEQLTSAVVRTQQEGAMLYGDGRVYLERAILPVTLIAVQILADDRGQLIHLGERQAVFKQNRKIISESPGSALTDELRQAIWSAAIEIGRLFNLRGIGSVQFLVDQAGGFFFTEVKARLNVDHPLTEWVTGVDLVRQQVKLSAGEPLEDNLECMRRGWALQARLIAAEPGAGFLPSPGRIEQARLTGGPFVRVDTAIQPGYEVLMRYDPLLAKISVWGEDRASALQRMRRALEEIKITGIATNQSRLQQYFASEAGDVIDEQHARHLAVAAALMHARRTAHQLTIQPEQLHSGWHRSARRLPGT